MDNIVPGDIGAVGGAVLVERPSNSKEVIFLCGPELITLKDAWAIIKKVSGRDDFDTTPLDTDAWLARISRDTPLPLAKELLRTYDEGRDPEALMPTSEFQQAVANIKKFSGREPTKFEDYIEAHKAEWQAV